MKKLILSLALVLSFATFTISQDSDESHDREESRKRIEASKVAYITTYLDLTSSESSKFWPIYNQYQSELKALRGERGEKKKTSELTEAEATAKLDNYLTKSSKKTELNAMYVAKYRSVLSDKQILMLHRGESEFKKQMVKRYAEHKEKNGNDKKEDRKE